MLSGTLFGLAALLLYASFFDFSQFLNVQLNQGAFRHTTFLTILLSFFGKPKAVDTIFFDGILLAGKLSFFGLLFLAPKIKQVQRMLLFSLTYIIFLGVTIGETVQAPGSFAGHGSYGWYWYPLFPVFMASLGYVLYDAWQKSNRWLITGLSLFFILQLRMVVLYLGFAQLGEGGVADWIVMSAFGGIFTSNFLPEKWWRRAMIVGLAFLVFLSVGAIVFFNKEVYLLEGEYFVGV